MFGDPMMRSSFNDPMFTSHGWEEASMPTSWANVAPSTWSRRQLPVDDKMRTIVPRCDIIETDVCLCIWTDLCGSVSPALEL